jgi:hypothetical protein
MPVRTFLPLRRYLFAEYAFFSIPSLIARYIVEWESLAPDRSIFHRAVIASGARRYSSPNRSRT